MMGGLRVARKCNGGRVGLFGLGGVSEQGLQGGNFFFFLVEELIWEFLVVFRVEGFIVCSVQFCFCSFQFQGFFIMLVVYLFGVYRGLFVYEIFVEYLLCLGFVLGNDFRGEGVSKVG